MKRNIRHFDKITNIENRIGISKVKRICIKQYNEGYSLDIDMHAIIFGPIHARSMSQLHRIIWLDE